MTCMHACTYVNVTSSVGSLGKYKNELDVDGIFVKNCTIRNTTNGARIKTWGGSGPSKASNIIYEDIIMENVQNPIIIDQHYGSKTKVSLLIVYLFTY